jgi:hypothetical protein
MRSSQWDDALKTVSRRRQELEAQQKAEAETAANVQASASKQAAAIREPEAVREQAARVTIASEQAELAAVKEAEAGKLRAVEVSAREQAAAVRALERQRSRAHQQMVVEADSEARTSKPSETHGIMSRHGAGGVALAAGAGYVGVHSVFGGVEKAFEAGAERQHIEVKAANAGIPASEIARIRQASIEAKRGAREYRSSDRCGRVRIAWRLTSGDVPPSRPQFLRRSRPVRQIGMARRHPADFRLGARSSFVDSRNLMKFRVNPQIPIPVRI